MSAAISRLDEPTLTRETKRTLAPSSGREFSTGHLSGLWFLQLKKLSINFELDLYVKYSFSAICITLSLTPGNI